jgi:hypothetical protein
MYQERKEDLSVYYYVEDLFSDVLDFTDIVDGFPTQELQIPTIAIESDWINTSEWELGNRNRILLRTWYVDVFAKNKTQRDEFMYRLLHGFEECIPVYDYDEGFPPDVYPTELGCLNVENLTADIVRVSPRLVDKLYYRATVSFTAVYNQLT